jgi:putative intracellular protease/amidase
MKRFKFLAALLFVTISAFGQEKKILIVATNVDSLGNNVSGTYLMEIAFPFKHFMDNGYEVDVLTPKGGAVALYHREVSPELAHIQQDEKFIRKTANTLTPIQARASDYVAVFYPGGHGQYMDVVNDERISKLVATIYEAGGVIGTAGHGAASLINIQLSNGKYLVDGKRLTCYPTWAEKVFMKNSDYGKLLHFDMEEVLSRRGARLVTSTHETSKDANFNRVIDATGRLVTGAFAQLAQWAAEETVKLLKERPSK